MAEDKSHELQVIVTVEKDGNAGKSFGGVGDAASRQNDGYVMAEDESDKLQVIAASQEFKSTAESSGGSTDFSIGQSDRSSGQEEDVQLQQVNAGENDQESHGESEETDSDDDEDFYFWNEYIESLNQGRQIDPEKKILDTVERKGYPKVHGRITAKALMNYSQDPLLLAMKIAEKLHFRAKEGKPDKHDFLNMANRVEEFTLRFLDPLKYNDEQRKAFFDDPKTDAMVETAIRLKQKKFFDHPVIKHLLKDRWHGDQQDSTKLWWLFLNVWCLFDMVFFPLTFLLPLFLQRGTYEKHTTYFTIPYFIFARDMVTYLALLALHLAICVQPSQLPFSGLEWAILVLFLGRLFTEIKQILDLPRLENGETRSTCCQAFHRLKLYYFRDRWNGFDLLVLTTFIFAIFPLRIITWSVSGSVTNNRALVIASHLYGLNTVFLTLRTFGSILETFKEVGTIQIALFHIIRNAVVVVFHFLAITLAFASAITKVYVAERSMVQDNITGKPLACNKAGIQCWWQTATHLAWSLLDLSEGLSDLESNDFFSETLANLLFAVYLVLCIILLINMLIALLSNTYQQVQNNSRNEWLFQKAITIETYRNYHPIPIPFNIISIFVVWIYGLCKTKGKVTDETDAHQKRPMDVKYLVNKYRLKYGDFLPPTDKLDQVLDDANSTESMVNQVLYRTFTHQRGCDKALLPTGQKAWETHNAILIDDYLITHQPTVRGLKECGARYKTPFSSRFPHFEVMILEVGETKWFGMGVVFENYGTKEFPGWNLGTVGYHTDDRKIFDQENSGKGRQTIGSTAARRGDVIRCTVMFEEKQERNGKIQVPIVFSVNGSTIEPKDRNQPSVEYRKDRPLFPYIAFKQENSVLAKMCAREDTDYEGEQMKSNFGDVKSNLECVQEKLDAVLAKLGEKKKEEKSKLINDS